MFWSWFPEVVGAIVLDMRQSRLSWQRVQGRTNFLSHRGQEAKTEKEKEEEPRS